MERFDALEYLALVERYQVTHSQLVPTMFSRMLKLPERPNPLRFVLSAYRCSRSRTLPSHGKEQMIDWWGPIIHEYYGATEGLGFAACNTEEWLQHKGTVGKVVLGELAVLDDEMQPLRTGEPGTLWFKTASEFSYHNDPEKTAESTQATAV